MLTYDSAPQTPLRQRLQLLLRLLVCAAGAALIWYATAWGVGVSPDSAEYIAAARKLHGLGDLLSLPAHWAPGYPLLLALCYLFGDDVFAITRLLQCLLFAGNLAAAMLLLRQICQRDSWLPALGGAVLLLSPNLWTVNFYAWSEGPFLLCQQLSAIALLRYFADGKLRLLMWAAVMAALALLFRYAGIAWIGAVALVVLWLQPGAFRQRLRNAVGFGVVAVLPFLLWLLVNQLARSETTNREFVIHLVTASELLELVAQFASWFGAQQGLRVFVVEAGLCVAVFVLALRAFSKVPIPLQHCAIISLTYVALYTLFILFSKSFLDAYIPFDDRIFVPAYLFTMLTLLACAQYLLLESPQRLRVVAILALLFVGVLNALKLAPTVAIARAQGIGYLSAYMASLPRVQDVPQLTGKIVYSNAPDYLRMQTDLSIRDYPRKFDPPTRLANPDYQTELTMIRNSVQDGAALLVHYQAFEWRSYFPTQQELGNAGFVPLMTGNQVRILSTPVARAVEAGPQ